MRVRFYSLRTGIVVCLILLIVPAMLLINGVMMKLAEQGLLDAGITTGRLLAQGIGGMMPTSADPPHSEQIARLLREGGFSRALIINADGEKISSAGTWKDGESDVLLGCRDALRTGEASVGFSGRSWGVTWFSPARLRVCAPIRFEDRPVGAVAVGADLDCLYQRLRSWESVVLGYIFLNAAMLALFGIFLLSRMVIRPIRRLLAITEKFDDWPLLMPAGEASRNEFGQLFRSLKAMRHRLEANRDELKAHIASLEKANLEIRKAQDELIRSEKMATAGRLATGVAHEIGNPLGIILGYVELLKRDDIDPEERDDFLGRVETEVNRIHHIIRELLDFSKGSGPENREAVVHDIIRETVHMLEHQPMMAHIRIEQALAATDDRVRAGAVQLQQVFLNILINAADAMDGRSTGDEEFPRRLRIETANHDALIRVSFMDTGIGISDDIRSRIFDPFYTTKEPGKGTGLGLSVCYTIMKGLGGSIGVQSEAGKGTTVTVEIPLISGDRPAPQQTSGQEEGP